MKEEEIDLSELYPQYHKKIPEKWKTIDTYGVNHLFPVPQDPSGIILHARKKLLVPGVRTGKKTFRRDIIEARDQLNRYLQMYQEDDGGDQ